MVGVPILVLLTGLPFAAVAALQWPGRPRRTVGGLLALAVLAAAVPLVPGAWQDAHDRRVLRVAGTLQRPWVTETAGLHASSTHFDGGTGVLGRYRLVDGPPEPEVSLLVQPSVPGAAECQGPLVSRYSEGLPVTSCRLVAPGTWLRSSRTGHEFLREVDGLTVALGAPREVPESVLPAAFEAARPMDDDEYDAWVDREAAD